MSREHATCRCVGLALTVLGSACGDEPLPPLRYETAQAVIGTDFAEPLCGRDPTSIDAHIAFVEDMLDAASDDPLEIYIYGDKPPQCRGSGCYKEDEQIVVAAWWAVEHEIVHAVVDRFADPPMFWSEGAAEALRQRETRRGYLDVTTDARVRDIGDLDYFTAGHFARFLVLQYGEAAFRRLLDTGSPESAYGRSLADLAAEYDEVAPVAYPAWSPCDFPALPRIDATHWHETIDVECTRPDVTRFSESWMSLVRSVDLDAGAYELRVDGGKGARVLGCPIDPLETEPPDMAHGATHSAVEHSLTARGVLFPSGVVHQIRLTSGSYKLEVPVGEHGDRVEISIRALDPRRVPG